MSRDEQYTRFISSLKLILPLVALGILSTLFLVAETLDPEAAIPYADLDVDRILRDQGVTRPAYGGLTNDGTEVSLVAERIAPDGDFFEGREIDLSIVFPEGGKITVGSPFASVNPIEQTASLGGGVVAASSTGYEVSTEALSTSWETTTLETQGEVRATGPAGEIVAGGMQLSSRDNGSNHLLVFNNGVRLVYVASP